jgi:MFS family permease
MRGALSRSHIYQLNLVEMYVDVVVRPGSAIVPLVSSPLSEMYGRVMILSAANIFYIVFNTLCGIAKTQNQLIACRFLAGLGGAGPFGVCISNLFLVYNS